MKQCNVLRARIIRRANEGRRGATDRTRRSLDIFSARDRHAVRGPARARVDGRMLAGHDPIVRIRGVVHPRRSWSQGARTAPVAGKSTLNRLRADINDFYIDEPTSSRLGGEASRSRKGSGLEGRKVSIKYDDRSGNTWAGRGAMPVWLREKSRVAGSSRISPLIRNRWHAARARSVAEPRSDLGDLIVRA
jgi:hypothetical protein